VSNNQVISDEAAEAAWQSFLNDDDRSPVESMRKALEAAAVPLLEEAWYRGAMEMAMQTGDSMSDDLLAAYKRNPYRSHE